MTSRTRSSDKYSINLHYIRAAIEANTGQRLPLNRVRELLVEEGLITPTQAKRNAQAFTGYSEFYSDSTASKTVSDKNEISNIISNLETYR